MVNEELHTKLSAYVDGELSADASREVELLLAVDPALRQNAEVYRRLDIEAKNLPVLELPTDADEALWEIVATRTVRRETNAAGAGDANPRTDWRALAQELPERPLEAPEISDERWNDVWAQVRTLTSVTEGLAGEGLASSPSAVANLPLTADLTPVDMQVVSSLPKEEAGTRRPKAIFTWSVTGVMALAATVMLVAWFGFLRTPREGSTGKNPRIVKNKYAGPSVNDEHYFMLVRHVPGVDSGVVCFFEKEDDSE